MTCDSLGINAQLDTTFFVLQKVYTFLLPVQFIKCLFYYAPLVEFPA